MFDAAFALKSAQGMPGQLRRQASTLTTAKGARSCAVLPPGPIPLLAIFALLLMVYGSASVLASFAEFRTVYAAIDEQYHIDAFVTTLTAMYEDADDKWDKCEKWKLTNGTAAGAPFSCSLRPGPAAVASAYMRLGLPFCCCVMLLVLGAARKARRLYVGKDIESVDRTAEARRVVRLSVAGDALTLIALVVAASIFLASCGAVGLTYPITLTERCDALGEAAEEGLVFDDYRLVHESSSEEQAEVEAAVEAQLAEMASDGALQGGGLRGCDTMLRLRGCALLATAACFRFGDIMDILYWVAPGSYINTDRVEAVCEHTERVTRSSSALCVEAGNGTIGGDELEALTPYALEVAQDKAEWLYVASEVAYHYADLPPKYDAVFEAAAGISVEAALSNLSSAGIAPLCDHAPALESAAWTLFSGASAGLAAAVLGVVLWSDYSNFVLLFSLRKLTDRVPAGALGCAAAFLAAAAVLRTALCTIGAHAAAAAAAVGVDLSTPFDSAVLQNVTIADLLQNVTGSQLETLQQIHPKRTLTALTLLLVGLALAIAALGAYARTRFRADGVTVKKDAFREGALPEAASSSRKLLLGVWSWAAAALTVLVAFASYKLVSLCLIKPGLLAPLLAVGAAQQPLCHSAASVLESPLLQALANGTAALVANPTALAGVERGVALSRQPGWREWGSAEALLHDDEVVGLLAHLAELDYSQACTPDMVRAYHKARAGAAKCVALPGKVESFKWVLGMLLPVDDPEMRCPAGGEGEVALTTESLSVAAGHLQGLSAPCHELVHLFEHDLLGMCELCISDSSPLCSSPLYGHYGYDQDIDSFRSSREASALSHLALVAFTINAELADYLNDALGHTPQPRAIGGGLLRSWLDGRLSAEDLLGTLVAQLHLAPTLTGRACAAIYEVEWSLLLLLLGAVAWLLTVLYLATRRHKYNLMLTLAAMKQELADDSKSILDSDGDGKVSESERAGVGKGYLAMLGEQLAPRSFAPRPRGGRLSVTTPMTPPGSAPSTPFKRCPDSPKPSPDYVMQERARFAQISAKAARKVAML